MEPLYDNPYKIVQHFRTSYKLKKYLHRTYLKNTLSLPNVSIGSSEFWMPAYPPTSPLRVLAGKTADAQNAKSMGMTRVFW